ncbi:MAG: HDIG domain-containing metalloprotein [Planctomycetota bacterium]
MPPGKSQNARRRDVRRAVPRPAPRWLAALRRRDVGWAALYALAFAVIASAVVVSVRDRPAYYVTQVTDRPVVARIEFQANDIEATEREREFAQRNVPAVFVHNQDLFQKVLEETLNLLNLGGELYEEIPPDYLASLRLTPAGHALLQRYAEGADGESTNPDRWADLTQRVLQRLFSQAILDPAQHAEVMDGLQRLNAVHPRPYAGDRPTRLFTARELVPIDNQALVAARLSPEVVADVPPDLKDTVLSVVQRQLAPTYFRSDDLTNERREAARAATEPVTVTYRPDQILVASGQRLTADDLQLIEAEREAYELRQPPHRWWLSWLGATGLMLMLAIGVWAYVFAYSPKIKRNPMRGLALTGMLLLCQATAVLLVGVWPQMALGGVAFSVLLGAMVFAIVYDQRFALTMGVALTALIVLSLRLPMSAAVVMMAGVAVAVAQLDEVRSRSKLVSVGLWAGLAMGVATAVGGLAERSFDLPSVFNLPLLGVGVSAQWSLLGADVLYTVLAGFSVGLLIQGILPTIEKVFHVTTAMTLRELNDAGHPLLQRLAQESAGTYQHSLRIADMTEAAADAIGADGLLCRVGAMYHDVGKINKPQYFIENQGGGPNKHHKLSPAMSLLVIVGHVKDGIEMAREYNLPTDIRHFIESHHGTTLVEYFYHAAKKQKEAEDKPAPSEFEFRYPGPKPQTKEAAIMLLCDGIEGAARAMDEPTPVRLEQLVHAMANKRLMDGQFDECNLTLRDLAKVEAAVTKTLCAVYHSRIKYPDGKKRGDPDSDNTKAKATA